MLVLFDSWLTGKLTDNEVEQSTFFRDSYQPICVCQLLLELWVKVCVFADCWQSSNPPRNLRPFKWERVFVNEANCISCPLAHSLPANNEDTRAKEYGWLYSHFDLSIELRQDQPNCTKQHSANKWRIKLAMAIQFANFGCHTARLEGCWWRRLLFAYL